MNIRFDFVIEKREPISNPKRFMTYVNGATKANDERYWREGRDLWLFWDQVLLSVSWLDMKKE